MRRFLLFLMMIGAGLPALAQPAGDDEAAIKAVLAAQADAWNRGDVPTFMQGYEDSDATTFVGATVRKGYGQILERYHTAYANTAQMGRLTFSNIDVRLLPGSCGTVDYAVVTGNFHLDRTTRGTAAKDDGSFSLVFHKGPHGWKITLDHSS